MELHSLVAGDQPTAEEPRAGIGADRHQHDLADGAGQRVARGDGGGQRQGGAGVARRRQMATADEGGTECGDRYQWMPKPIHPRVSFWLGLRGESRPLAFDMWWNSTPPSRLSFPVSGTSAPGPKAKV